VWSPCSILNDYSYLALQPSVNRNDQMGQRHCMNNHDLYVSIGDLSSQHRSNTLSLELYLLALLQRAEPLATLDSLTPAQFLDLLSTAFEAPPRQFEDAWRSEYEHLDPDLTGYDGWKATLIRQIVDLREMAEDRSLEHEFRYYGIDSPRGGRWYNFDPATYLECAAAGSLDGWEPGDDTGREFVPGECAVIDPTGEIRVADPRDLERRRVDMPQITWELFKDFVVCGQIYE